MRSTIPTAKRAEQAKLARDIAEYEAKHGPVKEMDSSHNAGYQPSIRDFRISTEQSKKRGKSIRNRARNA